MCKELKAAVKEKDEVKAVMILESEIAKERNKYNCQVQALADQNKELLKQVEELKAAATRAETIERDAAKWLSDAQEELEEAQAKNNTYERIILNLSIALSHMSTLQSKQK